MNESRESKTMGQNVSFPQPASIAGASNVSNSSDSLGSSSSGIVSDAVRDMFTLFNFAILCGILVIFGSTTNAINIIVFVKSGFKDTVNISLFALAVSDFGCCFSLLIMALCYNPLFQQLDLPFDPVEFYFLTSAWPHITCTRITSCITAFVTFERCLCVASPLRVKEIITPKRVTAILVCITVFVLVCISPVFVSSRYVWRFDAKRNETILVLLLQKYIPEINDFAKAIHSIFIPIATFFVVVASTIVLVISLRQKTKWRRDATKSSHQQQLSTRDARVSQMMAMVATLFIVCYTPVMASFMVNLTVSAYNFKGRYRNLVLVMFSFHFFLETLNSSLNIFIYYRMSSVYKSIFLRLFGFKSKENKQ